MFQLYFTEELSFENEKKNISVLETKGEMAKGKGSFRQVMGVERQGVAFKKYLQGKEEFIETFSHGPH